MNTMFNEVTSQYDYPREEEKILEFWEKNDIYQRSLAQRKEGTPFVFYEGPPTANGMPHPGHCITRAMKDLFPRYRTMCGYYCERRAGWDTHGLPVEVEVCKEIGIHSKEEIEEYGMEPFIHRCIQSVFRYTEEWRQLTRRLGFWVDLDAPYATFHRSFVDSVWWALKCFFDAGLLYQGHKIVWWWAQGGTALSAHEVGQGYRTVDDPSVYVRLPLVGDPNTSLLVWTTTPWTLPSNTFSAVNPELDYALVKDSESGEQLYVADALVDAIADKGKHTFERVSVCKGADLVGKRYVPPFDFYYKDLGETTATLKAGGEEHVAWRVVAADFVTIDSGTGLVHEAPAFGEVDFELFEAERARFEDAKALPLLCAVAPNGRFTADAGAYEGRWVKEADKDLTRELKDKGRLYHQDQYRHEYPFCWRAEEDPLIQYPRESWFIKTTSFVEDLLANNQEINWLPDHIKDGRFGKHLESNIDWSLSRERYWGTPLPIWVCEKTGHAEAIGSYDELLAKPGVSGTEAWDEAKQANPELAEDLCVHRPYIDSVTYASPKDPEARMRRVPEVIDCWFDSGAMPFAQFGYPHKNVDKFLAEFPADFISEALDQTRGWFYSLLAISTLLFGKNGVAKADVELPDFKEWPQPYRNCIVLGLLLAADGQKMSKQKKNYKTPDYIFDHQGADAMRWLFFSGQAPWTSARFDETAIADGQREFMIRLYNVYSFFVIYARIDKWTPEGDLRGDLAEGGGAELDRWVVSELHRTIREVRAHMDAYENFPAARSLNGFVDALSNWYLRRSRDRFWTTGMDSDKKAANATLYHCLVTVTQLMAPFVPFFAESLYQNLVGSRTGSFPESVHLSDYPEVDESLIDEQLSERMGAMREIVSLGRAARTQSQIKVRQPLSQVEIVLTDRALEEWLCEHADLIESELNVQKVAFIEDADRYVEYVVKPNFRSLGPKLGKSMPAVKKALADLSDPAAARRELDENGQLVVQAAGGEVRLSAEDVQVDLKAKEGWAAAQGRGAVVVLNTEITDELRALGYAREVIHHVQSSRKEMELAYEQRIQLRLAGEGPVVDACRTHSDYIGNETLATSVDFESGDGDATKAFTVDGEELSLWVALGKRSSEREAFLPRAPLGDPRSVDAKKLPEQNSNPASGASFVGAARSGV